MKHFGASLLNNYILYFLLIFAASSAPMMTDTSNICFSPKSNSCFDFLATDINSRAQEHSFKPYKGIDSDIQDPFLVLTNYLQIHYKLPLRISHDATPYLMKSISLTSLVELRNWDLFIDRFSPKDRPITDEDYDALTKFQISGLVRLIQNRGPITIKDLVNRGRNFYYDIQRCWKRAVYDPASLPDFREDELINVFLDGEFIDELFLTISLAY